MFLPKSVCETQSRGSHNSSADSCVVGVDEVKSPEPPEPLVPGPELEEFPHRLQLQAVGYLHTTCTGEEMVK